MLPKFWSFVLAELHFPNFLWHTCTCSSLSLYLLKLEIALQDHHLLLHYSCLKHHVLHHSYRWELQSFLLSCRLTQVKLSHRGFLPSNLIFICTSKMLQQTWPYEEGDETYRGNPTFWQSRFQQGSIRIHIGASTSFPPSLLLFIFVHK